MNYKKKDSGLSETKNGKADLLEKPLLKNGKKSKVGNKLSNGIKLKETEPCYKREWRKIFFKQS